MSNKTLEEAKSNLFTFEGVNGIVTVLLDEIVAIESEDKILTEARSIVYVGSHGANTIEFQSTEKQDTLVNEWINKISKRFYE